MTLISTGDLHLIGSSAAPTASICYELYGNYTGPLDLTGAGTEASLSLPVSISDFYGYSSCTTPNQPSVTASWLFSGVIRVYFTVSGDFDGVNIQYSTNNSTWYPLVSNYTGSSPYQTTTACANQYYRANAYVTCGGGLTSGWSGSYWAGTCP